MSLSRYWPTRSEINRCIKAEAESASDAVLLAAHQPMALLRRNEGSDSDVEPLLVSEHELLEAFLTDDLPQGTLLLPITGASGAGKSHLIRWLAAQLGRDPRARRMHVIRVPKSASLRDVVDLVLQPLEDDEHFANVRESLDSAISKVNLSEAAVDFSGRLESALKDLEDRLDATLRSDPASTGRRALQTRIYHARNLSGLFNEPALRRHMIDHVLSPIIQRAGSGRTEVDPNADELLPQFFADDLRLPETLHGALGNASKSVRQYYQTGLNRDNGAGFKDAAAVLNEVVDAAVQKVFRLDQATGGVTLESIILRVRELLMEQDSELALLIEDFAALSGIQQVLLNVCIQEAERGGIQVRSRMRTALALTDGYLVSRDTIATRAKHEWRLQPGTSTDDVTTRTVELVSAYLNAARWGEDALKALYSKSPRSEEADLTSWIRPFQYDELSTEESNQLNAFGRSKAGVPLFPFNESALEKLANLHLKTSGELRFNPRRIINFILRDILLDGRDDFDSGTFPPPKFQGASARADTAHWLISQTLPESERERLESFLVYWGGNPADPHEASNLPNDLFRAFNLEPPKGLVDSPTDPQSIPDPAPPPPSRPQKEPAAVVVPTLTPTPPEMVEWQNRLDDWAGGAELGQRDANRIRRVLSNHLERAIPWNALRLAKRPVKPLLLIPNARGNAGGGIQLPLADDHHDPTATLRKTLLGALRLDESGGRFDYSEADEDNARLANLIERLVADLLPHLERQRHEEIFTLSWILRRQSRLLGLLERKGKAQEREVSAINDATPSEIPDPGPQFEEWHMLQRKSSELRPEMQQELLQRLACFQGDGNTAYAADPTLLQFQGDHDDIKPAFLTNKQRDYVHLLKPRRLTPIVRPVIKSLNEFSAKLDNALGRDGDKQGLLSSLGRLLHALEPVGVWPDGITRPLIKTRIDSFRNDPLNAELEKAAPIIAAGDSIDLAADTTIEDLGRIDLAVIARGQQFLNEIESFVDQAQRDLDLREGELAGIDPKEEARNLADRLEQMDRDINTILREKSS